MSTIPFINEILIRLAADKRVRRELPHGGRVYLDRRLPFLCVYRRPTESMDRAAERLISTQASYVILPSGRDKASRSFSTELLRSLIVALKEHFGGFLILEIWLAHQKVGLEQVEEAGERGDFTVPSPWFGIHVDQKQGPVEAAASLARALRQFRANRQLAEVELMHTPKFAPSGLSPLLSPKEIRKLGCYSLGLEIRSIFEEPESLEVYPKILNSMRRSLDRAFKKAFFTFARLQTNIQPQHFQILGRRSFVKAVVEVDSQLAQIESSFDLILQVTPINAEHAWNEFRRKKFEEAPKFQYRPSAVEPTEMKRRLFQIPIERIEDVTLAYLFRQKQDELDRKISMIYDIGTSKFMLGSQQVFGGVGPKLCELATDIIRHTSPRERRKTPQEKLQAEAFADLARDEIRRYHEVDPTFTPEVEIRDDIFSGLLVSHGHLLIGKKTSIPAARAEALLQHEVGVHLVTYHNGKCQPFQQLAVGLAGYDTLQEGTAVLAEYLVGGLAQDRLRLLAARVLAVRALLDGSGFVDTFRFLTKELGFAQRTAYTVTMRVYRGGGMTKDAAYLLGLSEILTYLGRGGGIEPLLLGKIAADHIPLVEELRMRQVLSPPPLRPHFLDSVHYANSIARVRSGIGVLDLID